MFGVSLPELLIVMTIILIVFGPEKLPEAARTFGKLMAEFRKASSGIRREFYNTIYSPAHEIKTRISHEAQDLTKIPPDATSTGTSAHAVAPSSESSETGENKKTSTEYEPRK